MTSEETSIQEETLHKADQQPSVEEAQIQKETVEQAEEQLSDEELRRQLVAELDGLTDRLQAQAPEYEPPPFSVQRLITLIEETLNRFPSDIRLDILSQLRAAIGENLLDIDVLKGAWYMLNYTVQYNVDLVKRRFTGEYDTDEWGMDWEFLDAVRPFFTFLYKFYWRVEASGLENIPIEGRALLVANHSGQIPWDGTMVGTAVLNDHPAQRLVRSMYSDWFPRLPFLSSWLVRTGQTLATMENGVRLLEQDELVAVFPEGYKGIGKLYKDRYRLARFGRGGFVKMALATQAPIVPVSVVGAEETYIALAKSNMAARITGLPYVPITPTFPWLGFLGLVPFPTKWYMDFGQPIPMEPYGTDAADNLVLVSQVADQVRHTVQDMVDECLARRRSVFF
jgi:1-acyl-sn-glycerol-3-phosphate acyltransferase